MSATAITICLGILAVVVGFGVAEWATVTPSPSPEGGIVLAMRFIIGLSVAAGGILVTIVAAVVRYFF